MSFELPELGSIWLHPNAPNVKLQVLAIEQVGAQQLVYVDLDYQDLHQRIHLSISLETLHQTYICPATVRRPTQWEHLLADTKLQTY